MDFRKSMKSMNKSKLRSMDRRLKTNNPPSSSNYVQAWQPFYQMFISHYHLQLLIYSNKFIELV